MQRTCRTCGETKPLNTDHWHATRRWKDGWNIHCKVCINAYHTRIRRAAGVRPRAEEQQARKAAALTAVKACGRCRAEHPRTPEFFPKDRTRVDGLHPFCKTCHTASTAKYKAENREAQRAAHRKWWEGLTPERKAEVRAQRRARQQARRQSAAQ